MRRAVCMILVLALAACEKWTIPAPDDGASLPNVTIGDMRAYYGGAEGGGGALLTIADEVVISGRVVSSDLAGNFYNTFFIDDGTGAAEIMAGMYDLDAVYHPGQRVTVRARGLAVGWRDGVMQLGLPPDPGSRYATGYFYHQAVMRAYVTAERSVEPVEPVDVRISELDGKLCGRPVRISGLAADPVPTTGTWATTEPAPMNGYTKFRSSPADSITVVTSGYASFADEKVPEGKIALTGILMYGKGGSSKDHYLLKMRDEKDIEL